MLWKLQILCLTILFSGLNFVYAGNDNNQCPEERSASKQGLVQLLIFPIITVEKIAFGGFEFGYRVVENVANIITDGQSQITVAIQGLVLQLEKKGTSVATYLQSSGSNVLNTGGQIVSGLITHIIGIQNSLQAFVYKKAFSISNALRGGQDGGGSFGIKINAGGNHTGFSGPFHFQLKANTFPFKFEVKTGANVTS